MKLSRIISALLIFVMILSVSTSANAAIIYSLTRSENDFDLSDISVSALDKAKDIVITDDIVSDAIRASRRVLPDTSAYDDFSYTSSYAVGNYGINLILNLNWQEKDGSRDAHVSVTEDGYITSFSVWYERDNDNPVPDVSQSDAVKLAYDFITGANPDYAKYYSVDRARVSYSRSGTYTISFDALYNGVIISNASARVSVDYHTGSVYSFSTSLSSGISPSGDIVFSNDAIRSVFKEKLPMKLQYAVKYDREAKKSYIDLIYLPDASGKLIGADGEVYDVKYIYGGGGYKYAMGSSNVMMGAVTEEAAADNFIMSEAELAGVEYQSHFVSPENAKDIILNVENVAFNDDFKIESSYLSKSKSQFTDKVSFTLDLHYKSEKNEANATIDAETGRILSYSYYDAFKRPENYKTYTDDTLPYSEAEYRSFADELIKALYPDTYSEYIYDEDNANSDWTERYSGKYTEFDTAFYTYVRHNQGLEFTRDTITVSMRLRDKAIVKIYYSYSDCEFPSVDGIISADAALDIYADNIGFSPKLYPVIKKDEGILYIGEGDVSTASKRLLIGYGFDRSYYEIDAHTGDCEDVTPPAQYFTSKVFTDITDEKLLYTVTKLADMNVIERGEKYEPERAITQGEFAIMLTQFSHIPEAYAVRGDDTPVFGKDYDPDKALSRGLAAKAIVYARGYDEVAKLSGIFKTDFNDNDAISNELIGYVAIAKGLGVLDVPGIGDEFNEALELTRSEAAFMIFNEATRK
ncbi:MAG: hypothetical protein J6V93_02330 [Clostridia bacterium]|nr:hypothetical protein [Clostridia bacterium]